MDKKIKNDMNGEVMAVQSIVEIPTILDTISMMTGLLFLCVARAKHNTWTICALLDNINIGLRLGDELIVNPKFYKMASHIRKSIVVDDITKDKEYSALKIPKLSGFKSFILSPIILADGKFFGNLYGLGLASKNLVNTVVGSSITMLAEIISSRLSCQMKLDQNSDSSIRIHEEDGFLKELMYARKWRDRHLVNIVLNGSRMESNMAADTLERTLQEIKRKWQCYDSLSDKIVDSMWARMEFDGKFNLLLQRDIKTIFEHVITGISLMHPNRAIITSIDPNLVLRCDIEKLSQLLSNLLNNALVYGHPNHPVRVDAQSQGGIFQLTVANAHPISSSIMPAPSIPLNGAAVTSPGYDFGLSLFVIFEIAKAHAGKINMVCSNIDAGYVFTMRSLDFIERRKISQKVVYLHDRRLDK